MARLALETLSTMFATNPRLCPMYLVDVTSPIILIEDCPALGAPYFFLS
jgi:hypothetical protein